MRWTSENRALSFIGALALAGTGFTFIPGLWLVVVVLFALMGGGVFAIAICDWIKRGDEDLQAERDAKDRAAARDHVERHRRRVERDLSNDVH